MYECLVALLSKPSQINGAILPGDRDTLYQLLLLVTTYIYYHNIKLLQEAIFLFHTSNFSSFDPFDSFGI